MNESISFELTERQTELLSCLFDENQKETGAIIGQFMSSGDSKGFVVVGYMDNEKASVIQKMLGVTPGEKTPGEKSVFVVEDEI